MDLVFRKTSFRNELKSSFSKEVYMNLHLDFVCFLADLWFDDSETVSRDGIEQLGKLLGPLVQNGKVSSNALSQFLILLPKDFQSFAVALVEELKASVHVLQIKSDEKARMGENAVKTEYFRKSHPICHEEGNVDQIDDVKSELPPKSTNGTPSANSLNETTKNQAETQQIKKNPYIRSNPYAKSQSARKNEPPLSSGNPKRLTTTAEAQPEKKRSLNQNNDDSFSLKKILKQTTSETFTGVIGSRVSRFSSNAPKSLQCSLCDVQMEKPFISECGHMACLGCWKSWLCKSKTCPHCRKPCTEQSIALAVFTNGKKANTS
jgi:hypothetical protein